MTILISNDDSWGAKGLNVLIAAMRQLGDVVVVAPETPQSGMSSAVSFNNPLYLKHIKDEAAQDDLHSLSVYTCSGTPADCVKMGMQVLMRDRCPDLVCAGINHGDNSTVNARYSGTMGAVFVGIENNIPAIGFSICDHEPDADFSQFEPYLVPLTKMLYYTSDGEPYTNSTDRLCWNINAPKGKIEGFRFTRQARGYWTEEMTETQDEQGVACHKLGGYFVDTEPEATDTDQHALRGGFISVCPTTIDLTYKGVSNPERSETFSTIV